MRLCKEGWPFVGGCLIVAILCGELARVLSSAILGALAGVAFLAAAYCAYFFRDPHRVIPSGDNLVLSPADGKILEIVEGKDSVFTEPVWILRIFLSIFEPHLQRAPARGHVRAIRYKKGKFLDARDPQAAFENEQNRIEIVSNARASPPAPLPQGEGRPANSSAITAGQPLQAVGRGGRRPGEASQRVIVVTQIAGLIARRIICWVKEGQEVQAGERIGLIRFGSQVDIVLPKSVRLKVNAGDFVTAGDTVIAEVD